MKSTRTTRTFHRVEAVRRIFVPSDFAEIIQNVPDGCPLVGGQAVAWWAEHYGLSKKPITSCDIDFWGFRDDLEKLAKVLKQTPLLPDKYDMTAWVGGIPLTLKGEKTLVEFVHNVPGLDVFNPEKASTKQSFGAGSKARELLVLSPVSLVLTKLHALRAFDQSNRQDELHLKISLKAAGRFVAQLLEQGDVNQVLWNVERLIAASQNKPYRRLARKHQFEILRTIPIDDLRVAVENDAFALRDRLRMDRFVRIRWPQVKTKRQGG